MSYTLQCTTATPIESALSVSDVVELSWGVAACLLAAWLFKQMGKGV